MVSIAWRALMEATVSACFHLLQADVAVSINGRSGRFTDRVVDDDAVRAERADGIGCRRVAGQRKRLAAAAAEVDLLSRTAPAGLLNPRVAAECLEGGGLLPDPAKRTVAGAVEVQRRDLGGAVTGQRTPVRHDH